MLFLPNSIIVQDSVSLSAAELDSIWNDIILPRAAHDPRAIVDSFYCALRCERPNPDSFWMDKELLYRLYPYLTAQQQERLIVGPSTSLNVEDRIIGMLDFFPLWDKARQQAAIPGLLRDVLTKSPLERRYNLMDLAEFAQGADRERIIDAMLDTASTMPPEGNSEYLQIETLCYFFPYFNVDAQDAILDCLLTTDRYTGRSDNGYQRSNCLTPVDDYLTDAQIRHLIHHLDRFESYDWAVVRGALPKLRDFDRQTVKIILDRFTEPRWRLSVMELCAGKFMEIVPEVVHEAVNDLLKEPVTYFNHSSLPLFLPYLSAEKQKEIIKHLLDTAAVSDDPHLRKTIYYELAPYLTLAEIQSMLAQLLATEHSWYLHTLRRFIAYLPAGELLKHLANVSEDRAVYRVFLLSALLRTEAADQISLGSLWLSVAESFSEARDISLHDFLETVLK